MSEWISVKDRLPSSNEDDTGFSVDVLISDGKGVGMGYYEFEYFAEDPSEPLQYSSDVWHEEAGCLDTIGGGWPNVTHWMTLPEPPKE